jgi:hypothetical protein
MERLSKVSLVGCCIQLGADCYRSIFDEASRGSVDQHGRIDKRFGGKTLRSTLAVSIFIQSYRLSGGADSLGGRRASLNSEARTSSCRCKTCSGPTFGCPIRGDVLRCVGSGGRRCMEASLPGGTFSIVPSSDELYPFVLEFQGQLVHDFQACRQLDTLDAVKSRPSVSGG